MVNKVGAVERFRREFKKRYFFDTTGFITMLVLMLLSVVLMPIASIFFNIDLLYFFVMLQSANMAITLWVWSEVKKMRKEKD